MFRKFLVCVALVSAAVPAAVSGAALDDYYLARFGFDAANARALRQMSGEGAHAERCRTHLYRSLKRDWSELEPATQGALAKYVARPVLSDRASFVSPGGHFTIHYATTTASGALTSDVPDLTDGDNDRVPDWVETVADAFEQVYSVQVGAMGYRPPPGARYDVYLRDLVPERAFGFTSDDGQPAFPGTSASSYIEIDRAFTDPIYDRANLFEPVELLLITAAHEFHHAIQFGYNYYFDFWYAEMTATWIEDEVFDSVNQLYRYLPYYLDSVSSVPINAPLGLNTEYGRWIFNRYLEERYSSGFVKSSWVKLGGMAAPRGEGDIPMLPVLAEAVRERGGNLSADFLGFAKRMYRREWASHSHDVGLIPTPAAELTYSGYPVNLTALRTKIAGLPSYTFACFRFLPGSGAPAELTLALPDLPIGVEVVALRKGTDGSFYEFPLDRASGTVTVPSFNSATTAEVQLIAANTPEIAAVAEENGSGDGGGGGCFIATAAYGSYLHPKVAELRHFRDRHLLTNAPGRLFVALYYRVSPPLARVIAEHASLRAGTRALLTPLLFAVEYPLWALLALLLSGGAVVRRLKRSG